MDGAEGPLLQARRLVRATGQWSAPTEISIPAAGNASEPTVLIDATGDATVAWVATNLYLTRYSAATDTWGAPVPVADAGACTLGGLRGVNDAAGGVFLAWYRACRVGPSSAYTSSIVAARYDPTTAAVVGATLTPSPIPGFVRPDVVADLAGTATVFWPERGIETLIRAARYTAASGSWIPAGTLLVSPDGATAEGLRAGIDAPGNVTLLWSVVTDGTSPPDAVNAIRTARYDAASRQWSPVTSLATSPALLDGTSLTAHASGHSLALWVRHDVTTRAQAALFDAETRTWGAFVDLGVSTSSPTAAVDGLGNLTVVWQALDLVQAARRTAAGGISTTTLARADAPILATAAGVAGHVVVLWRSGVNPGARSMHAAEWLASPRAPSIDAITPGDGRVGVRVTPPISDAPAFAALTYDYSIDDGLTWSPAGAGGLVSPVWITGLTNGQPYRVRLRAVNRAGPGASSAAVLATPVPAPSPPAGFAVVASSGRLVTVQWTPTSSTVPVTGYVVEGGVSPGQAQASLPVASGLPTLTFEAPTGAYFLRVHAVSGPAWSAPSNEVRLFVEQPVVPSRPLDVRAVVNGSTVQLSWTNTFTGGVPTGVMLRVGGALTTAIRLPVVESFRVSGVPSGSYTVTVSAVNDAGESAEPAGVTVSVPATCDDPRQGPPEVPILLTASATGAAYHLAWAPPLGGPAVEGYDVLVSGAFTGTIPTASRTLSGVAAPGTYLISLAARNSCGVGPATEPVALVLR